MAIKNVPILDGQTIFDVALQTYGSIEYIFDIVNDSGLSGAQSYQTGDIIVYNDSVKSEVKNLEIKVQSDEKTYLVRDRQSVFDLSIQIYGTVENIFDLIQNNEGFINVDNQNLIWKTIKYKDQNNDNAKYFKVNKKIITTGVSTIVATDKAIATADGLFIETANGDYISVA